MAIDLAPDFATPFRGQETRVFFWTVGAARPETGDRARSSRNRVFRARIAIPDKAQIRRDSRKMATSILHDAPTRTLRAAAASLLALLALTAVHHVYGAWLFDTPWRLHIVFVSIPVAIVIAAAVPIARSAPESLASRSASWVFLVLGAIFVVGAIGLYEGGYNHALPNLQYVLGLAPTARPDLYVPPDDLLFQLTGVGQFVLAVVAAHYLAELRPGSARSSRRPVEPSGAKPVSPVEGSSQ